MKSIQWPIFVVQNDTGVEICECLEDARRDYEGIDGEDGAYAFFDYVGAPLRAVFVEPNRRGRFLGFESVSSGVFSIEYDDAAESGAVNEALAKTDFLEPSSRFQDLDEVKRHLGQHSNIANNAEQGIAPNP